MKRNYTSALDANETRRRVTVAFETYREKFERYGPALTWSSEHRGQLRFRVLGVVVQVAFHIEDRRLEIESTPPSRLLPFLPLAVRKLDKEIRARLDAID